MFDAAFSVSPRSPAGDAPAAATVTGLIVALGGCVSYPPGRDFPKSQSETLRLVPDDVLVAPFRGRTAQPSVPNQDFG